ncbi:MAG: tetratricopeptide repeat protein [Elusimicrobiota bacterium]
MKYTTYLLLTLIVCLSTFLTTCKKKDEFIKNPSQYLPVEKLNKIIVEAHTKIEANSEDIPAYIEEGIALYQKGMDCYPQAINQLKVALKLGVIDIRVFFYLAIMYDELNLSEKAFNYYEKFLRNYSKDFYMRLRYGNLFFRQNRYESASEQYELALSIEPKNQTALINLALSYKARDLYTEALEKFELAEKLKPSFTPETLFKVAETYFLKNDFINTEKYYQKACAKKSDSIPSLLGLGKTYLKINKASEAKKCFEKVLSIEPNNEIAKKYMISKKSKCDTNTPHNPATSVR